MGVYLRGNGFAIVQRFYVRDPLTGISTLADPTTVTFTVEGPDGLQVAYVYGTDLNITHPDTGVYVCELAPPLPTGDYAYVAVGTGAVEATGQGSWTILETGVLAPATPPVAVYGPCNGWIDGGDVARYDPNLGVGTNVFELDEVAEFASQLMYECSGRQFPGVCQRTVRPCADACSCFGAGRAAGLGPWGWGSWSGGGSLAGYGGWFNECGDRCGCGSESYVELAGYPIRRIVEVKIDGIVIPPDPTPVNDPYASGVYGGYRLDERRHLIRLAVPGPPVIDQSWPGCQDLSLDDDQPGTYSITYEWGAEPPAGGKLAAAQMAAELWKAQPANQGECKLPTSVTKIVRQGITIERVSPLAELIRKGATGLALVDTFIALTNPNRMRRRPAVFSPDVQDFGRKVGQ